MRNFRTSKGNRNAKASRLAETNKLSEMNDLEKGLRITQTPTSDRSRQFCLFQHFRLITSSHRISGLGPRRVLVLDPKVGGALHCGRSSDGHGSLREGRNGCFGPYKDRFNDLDWLAVGLERFDTALRCAEPMTWTGTCSLIVWSGNITIQMDTRSLVPFPKDQGRN
jgi:hypothetical protein